MVTRGWFQRLDPSSVKFLSAKGDTMERPCRNFFVRYHILFLAFSCFQFDVKLPHAASYQPLDKLRPALL